MTDPSSLPPAATWGQEILDRLELLASQSEGGPGVTRRLATPEHRAAHDLLAGWMAEAGMSVSLDAAANTVGRYEASEPGAPALMMGSHQDTVRQGGRYDGIMGVVIPLACVKVLHDAGERLPFALEVVAFSDEEGLRFGTGFFGSAAIIGQPRIEDLERLDEEGVSLAQALRDFGLDPEDLPGAARHPEELHGFVEVHIEQGPVLEAEGLPVGIVTDITHGANMNVTLTGVAGHAGTVPMNRRQDALAGAAEGIQAVEARCRASDRLVGTVGKLTVEPGASNVIPGGCGFSIDLRSPDADLLKQAVGDLEARLSEIAATRELGLEIERRYKLPGCPCSPWLMDQLEAAVVAEGIAPRRLFSGAGHDAMALRQIADIGMLFVRCTGGISHNPAEAITSEDAGVAARVLLRFLRSFDPALRGAAS
ncbi:MAG: allantoate amidohydrolase [Kiloniellales bacterium]|nr:allantoate amidohydrolase [Kiloniellales bacterium]MDJ0969701.1 allantoate amidohydrolase [Kiloniellales bacterium]MDJ0982510.1 allantoate amidohydrolase [Kiloniellales bacterium]